VRLHRADSCETSQAIYDRMTSERQREAKELRAQGFEWAQQIQAKADSERTCSCPKRSVRRPSPAVRPMRRQRVLSAAFSRTHSFISCIAR